MTYSNCAGKWIRTKGAEELLADNGWTPEFVEAEWQRILGKVEEGKGNPAIDSLVRSGASWDTLPLHLLECVPGLADELERKHAERLAEEAEERKAQDSARWKERHLGEYLLGKHDAGETLAEHEIRSFLSEFPQADEQVGGRGRWTENVSTVVEVPGDRFFRIDWQRGLTECQEDVFFDQPVEVELHEYEKTIIVREWLALA